MNPSSYLVEINLISAQSLKLPSPSSRRLLQPYAVAFIDPAFKLRTAVDRSGGQNPTWNDKFVFRIPSPLLSPDSPSGLSVQIYSSNGWCFPDSLIGSVRLLLSNLRLLNLPPDAPSFVAAGIRRPSGRIHGVLNVAAAAVSRVPLFISEALAGAPAVGYRDFIGDVSGKMMDRALKEWNGGEIGLGFQRQKVCASPSVRNLGLWGLEEEEEEEEEEKKKKGGC